MTMKYFIAESYLNKTPKQTFIDDFQENLNDEFYQASDWFTIQEETAFGSGEYKEVDVRINGVIDTATGSNQGDDWKKLLFKEIDHATSLGWLYYFDNNYWMVINTEILKNLTATVVVRRCNNTLRWLDLQGKIHSQPCIMDYLLQETRNYSTSGSVVVNPSGSMVILTQYNDETNAIKQNQRFLFGNANNWTAWKVQGGGINNFANTITVDNTTVGFIRIGVSVDYVNEQLDDLTNGIADIIQYDYDVILSTDSFERSIAGTYQLDYSVELNGDVVTRNVEWSSSNTKIATVSSTGLVTGVANGSCTITCQLEGNTTVYDTCAVTITATPANEYEIRVSPETNYLLETTNQTYTVNLYQNSTIQADTFTFAVTSAGVPTDNYTFIVLSGNTFFVENRKKYLEEPLEITCTSGTHNKVFSINLKGAW